MTTLLKSNLYLHVETDESRLRLDKFEREINEAIIGKIRQSYGNCIIEITHIDITKRLTTDEYTIAFDKLKASHKERIAITHSYHWMLGTQFTITLSVY
jgi:hypothetical protein